MTSQVFENPTISQTNATRSPTLEDDERLEKFLRSINRSQFNINRSISLLAKVRARPGC